MKKNCLSFWEFLFSRYTPSMALMLLRLIAGGMMLTHGLAKVSNFAALSGTFPDPIGLGSTTSLVLIIFAEVGCSLLLILGLFTRLAVLPLMFGMIVAAFYTAPTFALATSEMALLYLGMYIVLFLGGPGHLSIDNVLWNIVKKRDCTKVKQ